MQPVLTAFKTEWSHAVLCIDPLTEKAACVCMYTTEIQTGNLNLPSSWGSSSQNIASAVLTPTSVELENDAPIANPSIKLWRPSPIMIIHATGAIFFFPTVSLPFSKESCVYKNNNNNPLDQVVKNEKQLTVKSNFWLVHHRHLQVNSKSRVMSQRTQHRGFKKRLWKVLVRWPKVLFFRHPSMPQVREFKIPRRL